MSHPVLLAYGLDTATEILAGASLSERMKESKLVWVHLDAAHSEAGAWLKEEMADLDPLIVAALLADETRPRMTQIDDGVLLILRGVNQNDNADPEDMVSIRLWIDKFRVISARKRKLKAVQDIEERIKTARGPKTIGQFVCLLAGRLFERIEPMLTDLNEVTDDIEEKVLETADRNLYTAIVDVRKQAITYRRHIAPQKDVIGQLLAADLSWLSEIHKRHLREVHHRVIRYVEDLDAVRERAQIVKDELSHILTDKLNRNIYILSVISAVFLPLTFLTGLLGINVKGIPGAEDHHAFWIFTGLLVGIVFLQVVTFKRLRWF